MNIWVSRDLDDNVCVWSHKPDSDMQTGGWSACCYMATTPRIFKRRFGWCPKPNTRQKCSLEIVKTTNKRKEAMR